MMRSHFRGLALPFAAILILTGAASSTGQATTCSMCQLQLTNRTGPYRITAAKEGSFQGTRAPHIRVTIDNPGPRAMVLGGSPEASRVLLNFVTPGARGTDVVKAVPAGQTERIPAGSSLTLHVTYPVQLGRPGVYRFNVSYGLVDSNILTYTVK